MRKLLGLCFLASLIAFPTHTASAAALSVVYPPTEYQTTSERVFFLGTAPPTGEVLINGQIIKRSHAGHFAPSLPLQLGDNLFTVHYQGGIENEQELKIKVKRLSLQPQTPVGLNFGKDSLTPSVDISRLIGEVICFGAIAPPMATVSVHLSNQIIPLFPQSQSVHLPANSSALTQQNQPHPQSTLGQYQGCSTFSGVPALLGLPQFQMALNGRSITQMGTGKIQILSPEHLQVIEVTADSGTARTGPSTDYSRLTPLPKGTQAAVSGIEGEWFRLDYGGWIKKSETRVLPGKVPPLSLIRSIRAQQVPGATEVLFPLQVPVPVSIQQGDKTFTLTLYNTTAQTDIIHLDDGPLISRLDWQQISPGQVQYTFHLKSQQQWGYQLRYEGTTLVLSLRHPPAVTTPQPTTEQNSGVKSQTDSQSLKGIKILLDPGHGGQESGTEGPTGYQEKAVTLIMAKLVRDQLLARGATVFMTREEDKDVSLQERVAMIDKLKPAISVSIHYNSLPDEGDTEHTQGMGAFWYNTQAHSLAVFMHNYIVQKLGRPSYGVFWDNLALTRPTSAPAVLLELGFMSNPEEFEWVVNPEEQQKLAATIADGITQWLETAQ